MINNIICPKCFSKDLYRYGKNKHGFQKYQCKSHRCLHQFTPDKPKKIPSSKYPKCPVCGASTYLHHDYEFYSRFTCNSKKCNHHFSVIKPSIFLKEVAKLPNAINLKRLRTNINLVIEALFIYFGGACSTRYIAKHFANIKSFKISHVASYKWIKGFGTIFKKLTEKYIPKDLNLSDEWHVDETVIKIAGKRYYTWTLIDSETRYVIDWYLTTSREATSAFHLFSKVKERFGSASTIVSDRLPSYNQATKVVFEGSKHLKVQFWYDETTNNLIESFFKRLKHKYRTFHGLKVKESVEAILQEFFFFYNYILPHSSLNNEIPARVAGVEYTEIQRKELLLY